MYKNIKIVEKKLKEKKKLVKILYSTKLFALLFKKNEEAAKLAKLCKKKLESKYVISLPKSLEKEL